MPEISFIQTCECILYTGKAGCNAKARYLVSVGTRKSDSQYSCGRHLARTCEAFVAAELRDAPVLTVTIVRSS
jgi:hypothetical protein